MKKIQVHCFDANGTHFIMNRMTSDNMDVGSNYEKYKQLLDKAIQMAYTWSKVYPHDKFKVMEI